MSETLEARETDPDRGVLERVAAGDVESFGVLVERHQDRLIGLCGRLLGDPEEAREATQEVFLKAYRNSARYRPRGRVYTWLYRIAVNHCLNRLRRRKIVQFLTFGEAGQGQHEDDALPFDPADPGPDAADRLADKERWRSVREQIDALPASQRTVLILAKLEGLSYREIADTLGITLGAVESRLFRAMRRLTKAQETPPRGVTTAQVSPDESCR